MTERIHYMPPGFLGVVAGNPGLDSGDGWWWWMMVGLLTNFGMYGFKHRDTDEAGCLMVKPQGLCCQASVLQSNSPQWVWESIETAKGAGISRESHEAMEFPVGCSRYLAKHKIYAQCPWVAKNLSKGQYHEMCWDFDLPFLIWCCFASDDTLEPKISKHMTGFSGHPRESSPQS